MSSDLFNGCPEDGEPMSIARVWSCRVCGAWRYLIPTKACVFCKVKAWYERSSVEHGAARYQPSNLTTTR